MRAAGTVKFNGGRSSAGASVGTHTANAATNFECGTVGTGNSRGPVAYTDVTRYVFVHFVAVLSNCILYFTGVTTQTVLTIPVSQQIPTNITMDQLMQSLFALNNQPLTDAASNGPPPTNPINPSGLSPSE